MLGQKRGHSMKIGTPCRSVLWIVDKENLSSAYAPPKRVVVIEQQRRFCRDECRPANVRHDARTIESCPGVEAAADDALLPPDLARLQLAVGDQARDFGAGPRAARRAVVRFT